MGTGGAASIQNSEPHPPLLPDPLDLEVGDHNEVLRWDDWGASPPDGSSGRPPCDGSLTR